MDEKHGVSLKFGHLVIFFLLLVLSAAVIETLSHFLYIGSESGENNIRYEKSVKEEIENMEGITD